MVSIHFFCEASVLPVDRLKIITLLWASGPNRITSIKRHKHSYEASKAELMCNWSLNHLAPSSFPPGTWKPFKVSHVCTWGCHYRQGCLQQGLGTHFIITADVYIAPITSTSAGFDKQAAGVQEEKGKDVNYHYGRPRRRLEVARDHFGRLCAPAPFRIPPPHYHMT